MIQFETDIYILIIAGFAVFYVLVSLAIGYIYLSMIKKNMELKEQVFNKKQMENELSAKITDQAQVTAQTIISEAQKKASQIATRASLFDSEQTAQFKKELEKIVMSYEKSYANAFQTTQEESIKLLNNISKDIKEDLLTEVKSFKEKVAGELERIQKDEQEMLHTAYSESQKRIQAYETQKFQEIDKKVILIIKEVTQQYLRRAINSDEHTEIVVDALEKAKKKFQS